MTEQIRLRALLKEPQYRAWFTKVPNITVMHLTPPWRLYVQMEAGGRWAKVDLPSYAKAYTGVKSRLQEAHDMTIHCRPQPWRPPIVQVDGKKSFMPCPDGHNWCVYCRRPTVFGYFVKHPAMPGKIIAEYDLRCGICAARLAGMKRYKAKFPWEVLLAGTLL